MLRQLIQSPSGLQRWVTTTMKNTRALSTTVALGDKVSLKLEGKFPDGTVFDTRGDTNPLSFIVGNGEMILGVEEAVVGMHMGAQKVIVVPPEKAFGSRNDKYVVDVKHSELKLKDRTRAQVGMHVMCATDGQQQRAIICALTEDTVTLDMNHPMAGRDLHFHLQLVGHTPMAELCPKEAPVVPTETSQRGDGQHFPRRGDRLKMHYVGNLKDGTQFDSSRDRNEPFEFQIGVGQVIQGWDEGVMRMSVGQRAKLYIPSAKAYGKTGAGKVIPPHSDLIFDVELLEILSSSS